VNPRTCDICQLRARPGARWSLNLFAQTRHVIEDGVPLCSSPATVVEASDPGDEAPETPPRSTGLCDPEGGRS